jgi:hypothetical protein
VALQTNRHETDLKFSADGAAWFFPAQRRLSLPDRAELSLPTNLPWLPLEKFDHAIYVLHCFQKKAQKTSKADLRLAALRYRELLKELGR